MNKDQLEILKDIEIPEAIRSELVKHFFQKQNSAADRSIENKRLANEKRKNLLNAPFVAVLASLVTLSATFVFDIYIGRDNADNTITIEEAKQRLNESGVKTSAQIEAEAIERKFQYELVRELMSAEMDRAERAAFLEFYARAGIFTTLNSDELVKMASEQKATPDKVVIPSINYATGIVGQDDAIPIDSFPPEHSLKVLSNAVGRLTGTFEERDYICTAFLISKNTAVSARHCVEDDIYGAFNQLKFDLGGKTYPVKIKSLHDRHVILETEENILNITPLEIKATEVSNIGRTGIIYYRSGERKFGIWDTDECVILSVFQEDIFHSCDTGGGSSGSPIFDISTNEVIGIHHSIGTFGKLAVNLSGQ